VASDSPTIQIGSATLDPGTQRLQVGRRNVRLDPKEMQVLLELAASAPDLVTRESLLARVWAGTVVGENALDQVIARLRRALRDDARHPGCIETLPRRGYRLMVPVVRKAAPAFPAEAANGADGTSPAPLPLAPRLGELASGPFVGRSDECARLNAALGAARGGARRLVLVAGEPGIGKTRLAAEFGCGAHAAGARVLAGRCDEDLGAPFQPWVQALEHLARHAPLEELRALLDEDTLPVTHLVPELRRRLPDLPQPPEFDTQSERWRLFEAIDRLLAGASLAVPVLVLLDDLHWADAASLALLRHVARSPRLAALLVVGTYRETELGRTHPLAGLLADLRPEPRVERVRLRGLAEAELGALVAARTEHEAPAGFVRALHEQTEGNPFFADEVLRHLVEAGALRREDGRWTTDRPLSELGIPEGVREVVGRRLARLSETANQALRAAAVVGREFEATVVEAAAGLARDALLDALDEAARAQIVAPMPGGPGRFSFAHALIQQTLYAELGSAERMRLHWCVGEALERRHAHDLDAHASAIARHLAEGVLAGDPLRSADASLRAGERAAALAGHEDAKAHFERALATLDQASRDEPERRHRACMGIGQALLCLGEMTAHREPFLQAFCIAQAQGSAERMAEAAIAATWQLPILPVDARRALVPIEAALAALGPRVSPHRALLLGRRAWFANIADADYDAMQAGFEEAAAVADRCGDANVALTVRHPPIFLLTGSPQIDEYERRSKEYLEAAVIRYGLPATGYAAVAYVTAALARGDRSAFELRLEEFRQRAERAGARGGSRNLVRWHVALALAEGRFEDAKVMIAGAQARSRDDPSSSLLLLAQEVVQRVEQGQLVESADALAAFLATAPRFGQYSRAARALVLAQLARGDDARRDLEAFDALALQPRGPSWPMALRCLAESAALLADEDRARALAPMLEPYAGQLLVTYGGETLSGSADRARGQVAATLGRLDDAVACYESGLALEESFGAAALAARTRYWLARALARRGTAPDTSRARAEATAARDAACAFGMEHLAAQAQSLADSLP
jgi:DNA-binding winged helix-turn-helix (wHTH) protein/tetratricopeptide (TPR) repeat protein